MNAPNVYLPSMADLQRMGAERAGPYLDDCDDATRLALDTAADPFTRAKLQTHLCELAKLRYAYVATLPDEVQDREIARLENKAERLQRKADALEVYTAERFGKAAAP